MPIDLPEGFVDLKPKRGPWNDPSTPPAECETVEILFANGTTGFATWTGTVWWRGMELHPIGWRRMDDYGMSYHPPTQPEGSR